MYNFCLLLLNFIPFRLKIIQVYFVKLFSIPINSYTNIYVITELIITFTIVLNDNNIFVFTFNFNLLSANHTL